MRGPDHNNWLKFLLARVATISAVEKFVSSKSEGLATVFLLHRADGVYDCINGHDPEYIERLLIDLRKSRLNIVSLQQVVEAAQGKLILPSRSIAFTVDDGYRDQLEVIAPIFVKQGVPLTVFLTTGLINNELWPWDAKINWLINHCLKKSVEIKIGRHCLRWPLGSLSERRNTRRELQTICAALPGDKIDWFLHAVETAAGVDIPESPPGEFAPASWDQVRQLEREGVRFAPHTHTHRILSQLPEAEVRSELSRSLETVRAETRFGLSVLAYPVGTARHFGLREMRIAESAGFSAAFAVCDDYARWGEARVKSEVRYRLARFGLPRSALELYWLATGIQAVRDGCTFWEAKSIKRMFSDYSAYQGKSSIKRMRDALLRLCSECFYSITGRFDSLKRIHAERINRLIFVCRGNVCRSAYAEAAAKSLGLSALSCGVDVSRSTPAETMAVHAALLRGKDISWHMSRSIYDVPLESSDCLVIMDPSQLPVARDMATRIGCQITHLGLWDGYFKSGIYDPYGKTLQIFNQCFDEIDEALDGLVTWIEEKRKNAQP